ncbi:MAG: hypothetical protein H7177_00020 [Rhizobacter sp.]|nr:hypothetical protein [Bacteriovorax sp.]
MLNSKKNLFTIKYAFQILLLVFSILLISEGLWGSAFAPKNLTTLFVWVHYRGLLVFLILLLGNFFCMSCPFIFVRNCLRVFISPKKLWPKKLQNKWAGIFFFTAVLFCYEYFHLWSQPAMTAYLIIAYFVVAIIIDLTFKKAAFCKYLCPIGQFNFLSSTISPKTVAAKNLSVCDSCTTIECLKGVVVENKIIKRGCETHLLMPKKIGNLDCTFCMDCVEACPYDNIALKSVTPTEELWSDHHRSGVGTLSKRPDILFLIIVFTFGALLNAFSMVAPAYELQSFFTDVFNIKSQFILLLIVFIIFLIAAPLIIIPKKQKQLIPSLLPLGFSIWLAHYSFHLLTGIFTFIPLLTKISIPTQYMGMPVRLVTPIQYGFLILGFAGSIIVTFMMNESKRIRFRWISAHLIILLAAIWIMSLPMEMRGTFIGLAP